MIIDQYMALNEANQHTFCHGLSLLTRLGPNITRQGQRITIERADREGENEVKMGRTNKEHLLYRL